MDVTAPADLAACWEETPLHTAVRLGIPDLDAARQSMPAGIRAMTPDALGWTPLHLAAVLDRAEDVSSLLAAEADLEERTADGRTALGLAAAAGATGAVRRLLAAGASVSDAAGHRTILGEASDGGSLEVVELLVEAGATTTEFVPYLVMILRLNGHRVRFGSEGVSRGQMGDEPDLWFVDRPMHLPPSLLRPIAEELGDGVSVAGATSLDVPYLARFDVSPGAFSNGEATPPDDGRGRFNGSPSVSLALRAHRLGSAAVAPGEIADLLGRPFGPGSALAPRTVIALIRLAGLDPATLDKEAPNVAKTLVARTVTLASESAGLLDALLDAGVGADPRDSDGRTPLMFAAMHGIEPAVDALLAHGADPALADASGQTAEKIAAAGGHGTLASRLQGAVTPGVPPGRQVIAAEMVEAFREFDGTALRALVAQHGIPAAAEVTAHPHPFFASLERGYSLLALAVKYGQPAHVAVLLTAGADPNETTPDGNMPLHLAARRSAESTRLLLAAGADATARAADGSSPLHIAADTLSGDARQIAAALLAGGADPLARDDAGRTALERAHPTNGTWARELLVVATGRARAAGAAIGLWDALSALIERGSTTHLRRFVDEYPEVVGDAEIARRAWDLAAAWGNWCAAQALFAAGMAAPDDPMAAAIRRHTAITDFLPGEAAFALVTHAAMGAERSRFLLDAIAIEGRRESALVQAALFASVAPLAPAGSAEILIAAGAVPDIRAGTALAAVLERMALPATLATAEDRGRLPAAIEATSVGKDHPALVGVLSSLADHPSRTPLMFAVDSAALADLLAAGADATDMDELGRSALHVLAEHSVPAEIHREAHRTRLRNLDLLIEAGAPVDQPDRLGRRPICRNTDNLDFSERLLAAGASPRLSEQERLDLVHRPDYVAWLDRQVGSTWP